MKRILFVDDEVQILKSLSRLFLDTEYDVRTADSGENALKVLESEDIDLIVSDMRMPFMDGYQLLNIVRNKYPKILRIILSGYADEKIVHKALLYNICKIYIMKPWNNESLIKLIDNIFQTEKMLTNKDLLQLINNLEQLPTIHASYQRVIAMIEKDEEITEISREIERDPSISIKVLQIANSAFYGVKTGSVKQAVTYLGLQNIRSIVLTTSIMDTLGVSGIGMDYLEKLWKHAFLTNRILHYIYEKCLHKKIPDTFSSAGLLHNIGIIFMLKSFSGNYLKLMKRAEIQKLDLIDVEQVEYKATHQETGGYLLQWWDLPFPIVEAALFHHKPLDENIVNTELVICVHISQKYAWEIMKGPQLTRIYPEVFERIGLLQDEFEESLKIMSLN